MSDHAVRLSRSSWVTEAGWPRPPGQAVGPPRGSRPGPRTVVSPPSTVTVSDHEHVKQQSQGRKSAESAQNPT